MAVALRKASRTSLYSLSNLLINRNLFLSTSAEAESATSADIKSAILSEYDPDRIVDLFESSSLQFIADRSLSKISIQKLARSNRPDLIERILEAQKSDRNLPRSESTLFHIITLYSVAGMVDHAVRTFDSLPHFGIRHSERSLCHLLSVLLKNQKHDLLLESFHRFPQKLNISPGITGHALLLRSLCDSGDVDGARKVLDEMPQKGMNPDVVSYNTVFNGYLKRGDYEGCDEILTEMSVRGFGEDPITYKCRIAGLCAKGKSSESKELLGQMSAKGVRLDRHMFHVILDGFVKEGNGDEAMSVFNWMKSAKKEDVGIMSPNVHTYFLLIKSFIANGNLDKGLEVFNECLDREWVPPFPLVKVLVEGLKNESKVDDAKVVLAKMRGIVNSASKEAWKKVEELISF